MLKARDFRYDAWKKLSGKWGTVALIALIYVLVTGAIAAIPYVGAIVSLVLSGPFALGFATVARNVIRVQSIAFEQIFDGFKNFLNAFLLHLLNSIFTALWSLLFIIPGIVASYSYRMSFYIMLDNPGIDANDARKASINMMSGNKWRLFCLDFSFIGWYLLCGLTFGILTFWVSPYHESASFAFYQSLLAEQAKSNAPLYGGGTPVQPQQPVADPFTDDANKDNSDNTF